MAVLKKNITDWMHFVVRSGAHCGRGRVIARQFVEKLDTRNGSQKKNQQVFHLFATLRNAGFIPCHKTGRLDYRPRGNITPFAKTMELEST